MSHVSATNYQKSRLVVHVISCLLDEGRYECEFVVNYEKDRVYVD